MGSWPWCVPRGAKTSTPATSSPSSAGGADRVKILTFSRGGFVLYHKRLETGRFRLPPVDADAQSVQLDATQLATLLGGIDVAEVKRQPAWTPPGLTGT